MRDAKLQKLADGTLARLARVQPARKGREGHGDDGIRRGGKGNRGEE